MARRRSNIRTVSKTKRLSEWFGIQVPPTIIALNALGLIASLTSAALAAAPFTIVRTRGILTVWSDQSTASEAPEGILGQVVVQNTAVLIGASAVPDPLNEFDADFFVYQPVQLQDMRLTASTSVDGFTEVGKTQWEIDSKAMRKVDTQEDIAVVFRNSSAADGLVMAYTGRFLVKLH